MKHGSKITLAGALLLASSAYADPNQQDITSGASAQPGSTTIDTSTQNTQSNTTQATPSTPSSTAAAQSANGKGKTSVVVTPDSIQWTDAPKMLPVGAQMAVLDGNLKSKGVTTVRFKLPANYQLPPVMSQNVERSTVLSGSLNLGYGKKLDTNSGTALPAGSYFVVPAKKPHYAWTTEETVIQTTGTGPFVLKYINTADDPRKSTTNTSKSVGQTPDNSQGNTNPSAAPDTSSQGTTTPSTSTTPASTTNN